MLFRFASRSLVAISAAAGVFSPALFPVNAAAQQPMPAAPVVEGETAIRGSIVEDRLAKKLIEAGDARVDADEGSKAVEIWKSVIERYPRSKFRFEAHLRLGNYLLDKERAYERARPHFEATAAEDNRDEEQRAEATLKLGVCFYHNRNYGKSFQIMRDVIEKFPVSPQVNEAYYYIGLGHFQLGHYSRAIQALEKVGTTLSGEAGQAAKLEAGKRFFLKIEDADLAVLEPNQTIKVLAKTTSGDEENIECFPVGRNVRLVLGSLPSRLGKPVKQNGMLDVKGGDKVSVTYTDEHTADKKQKVPVNREVVIVGTANVAVTDGAFAETVNGVVLGKTVNVRIHDGDRDVSDGPDAVKALIEVWRQKSETEIEAEIAALKSKPAAPAAGDAPVTEVELDRFKLVDKLELTLTEAKGAVSAASRNTPTKSGDQPDAPKTPEAPAAVPGTAPAAPPAATAAPEAPATATATASEDPVDDGSLHTGIFQANVSLVKVEAAIAGDQILQALPSDQIRVTYVDELHFKEDVRTVVAKVACLEGNIGGVRVTKAEITDQQLRVQTQLKTADALTQIGNRYKEFGLKEKAVEKYDQALAVCDDVADEARKLGGALLEQTYVQLWNIYFAMDKLDLAAAMCARLQNEFPSSGFVDDAMLQLGDVAKKSGDLQRAIGIYSRLADMKTSQLRGEAQFGIAECYETMAAKAPNPASASQMQDRAFQEFKKVYDQFPESGRVGEAVAKMANYYYTQKDYARAVDTFETVLNNHPDAKFLDVILFNYGRCLYRMERKGDARRRFDQLIGEFPESPLAADAKKISEALAKAGF